MARLGPITTDATVERTDRPSVGAVEATVRWAVAVENAAAARFVFDDRITGESDAHYQLFGPHHHLSALDDRRIERARSLFGRYGAAAEQLEPRLYEGHPSIDVELPEVDADTHAALAVEVLEDVYNTDPGGLERAERETEAVDRAAEAGKMAICHRCAESRRVAYMVRAYGDVYYRAVDGRDPVSRDVQYDFVFAKEGWWVCAVCLAGGE